MPAHKPKLKKTKEPLEKDKHKKLEKHLYILIEYLKTESCHIDRQKFKERLLSDPNNIVTSITNTLDYFEIKNIVAEVPKESLNSLPNTFIAQFSKNNQFTFVLINKEKNKLNIIVDEKNTVLISNEEFLENWTGLVIAIEKNEKPKNNANQKESIPKTVLIVFALLAILHISIVTKSVLQTGYFTLSIIGFVISFLILKEKLSLNSVPSRFCTLTKNSSCETVLNSKEANFFGLIDLSDSSIIYFSFIVLAFIYNPSSALFHILSLLSLPIIIYSIFYQKFKIKKWCPLCLGIASILTLQFIVVLLTYKKHLFEFKDVILLLLLLGFVMSIWFIVKPLLITKQKYNALKIENLTFRRNYHLFLPYYHSLKEINNNLDHNTKISLGAENPIINLIAITNPLCVSCKESHKVYTRLLQKHPNEIQISFVFLVPDKNRKITKTKISERLLQIYCEEGAQLFNKAIEDWFSNFNSEKWHKKWKENTDKKYNTILKEQVNWSLENEITSTPTLIINEKIFPEDYQIKDIENFIEPILEFEKNKNIHA